MYLVDAYVITKYNNNSCISIINISNNMIIFNVFNIGINVIIST